MVDDPSPALRAEIQTAVDALEPIIRGLQDFAKMSISPDAIKAINAELVVRQRRLDLLNTLLASMGSVISNLNALYTDGYPTFSPNQGAQAVFQEIQTETADLQLASNLFRAGAVGIALDTANAVHTLQPVP